MPIINIEDLRRAARRRLPRAVFDYIDGGAERETTLRDNCGAFDAVTFRPRCAVAFPSSTLPRAVLTGAPVRRAILEVDRVVRHAATAPNSCRATQASLSISVRRAVQLLVGNFALIKRLGFCVQRQLPGFEHRH